MVTRDGKTIRLGNHPNMRSRPGRHLRNLRHGVGSLLKYAISLFLQKFRSWRRYNYSNDRCLLERKSSQRYYQGSWTYHEIFFRLCLELAGVDYPKEYMGNKIQPVEGKSLVELFTKDTRRGNEAIFFEHEGNRAIRKGKWRAGS